MYNTILSIAGTITLTICLYKFWYDPGLTSYRDWQYLTLGILYLKVIHLVGKHDRENPTFREII